MAGVLVLAAGVPRAFDDQRLRRHDRSATSSCGSPWSRSGCAPRVADPERRTCRAALRRRASRVVPGRAGSRGCALPEDAGTRRLPRARGRRAGRAGLGRARRPHDAGTRATSPSATACSRSSCWASRVLAATVGVQAALDARRAVHGPRHRHRRRAADRVLDVVASTSTCPRSGWSSGRGRRSRSTCGRRSSGATATTSCSAPRRRSGAGLAVAVDQVHAPQRPHRHAGRSDRHRVRRRLPGRAVGAPLPATSGRAWRATSPRRSPSSSSSPRRSRPNRCCSPASCSPASW